MKPKSVTIIMGRDPFHVVDWMIKHASVHHDASLTWKRWPEIDGLTQAAYPLPTHKHGPLMDRMLREARDGLVVATLAPTILLPLLHAVADGRACWATSVLVWVDENPTRTEALSFDETGEVIPHHPDIVTMFEAMKVVPGWTEWRSRIRTNTAALAHGDAVHALAAREPHPIALLRKGLGPVTIDQRHDGRWFAYWGGTILPGERLEPHEFESRLARDFQHAREEHAREYGQRFVEHFGWALVECSEVRGDVVVTDPRYGSIRQMRFNSREVFKMEMAIRGCRTMSEDVPRLRVADDFRHAVFLAVQHGGDPNRVVELETEELIRRRDETLYEPMF